MSDGTETGPGHPEGFGGDADRTVLVERGADGVVVEVGGPGVARFGAETAQPVVQAGFHLGRGQHHEVGVAPRWSELAV